MLSKLMLLKKTVYDKLTAKVNNIDTSDFVLKTKYQRGKTELEKKSLKWVTLLKNETHWMRKQNSRCL